MKRSRELTSIHYHRSIRRPASPNARSSCFQGQCPVCGNSLEAILVSEPADTLLGSRIALRLVKHESVECSKK